jgi:hypothetical protein
MEAATSDAQQDVGEDQPVQHSSGKQRPPRADCDTYATRSRELDAKLQACLQQITRLEGESRCWQEHNAKLLSKVSARDRLSLFKLTWLDSMIVLTPLRSKR